MYVPSPESHQPTLPREIVVKDSWINPLRKFTEGGILAKLNEAGVEGVPRLIHKQQVQGPHPSIPHKNAIAKANILHRDVSLLNLLLVSSNTLEKDCSLEFLDSLPSVAYEQLVQKLEKIAR